MKKKKSFFRRCWQWLKRIFIILFFVQLVYIILLRWVNPPLTFTQLNSWISGRGLHREFVSKKNISADAKLAFIAAEDQLFPDHNGFDFKSIKKAMKHNRKSKSMHGASTISQQTAKNVFLWQGRSWLRKGLEVYFTFMIEWVWGKKRILEVYLNVAETGKGVFGIEAAAKKYFNTPAKSLSARESAMIAASLPNPKRFTVKPLSPWVAARSAWILQQMNRLKTDPDIIRVIQ